MDFLLMDSVNNYVKNLGLKCKWNQKKNNGDFTPEEHKTEIQRKNDQFKKFYSMQQEDGEKDEKLSTIYTKINTGAKLTPDEMKYIQVKRPDLYQRLKNIEKEKKQYERELKKCKTKDDVDKLRFSKVAESLSAINSVKNNPNIPDSVKLEVAAGETRRLNELGKVFIKFVKSGEYDKLPTEAEKAKAEKDIEEARAAEKEDILRADKDNNISETDSNTESVLSDYEGNAGIMPDNKERIKNEYADDDIMAEDKKMTRTEAEHTPEALKLRRSKAKAAYKRILSDTVNEHTLISKE